MLVLRWTLTFRHLGNSSMNHQTISAQPMTTSRYQRLFGIRLRALVLALFAYVGSGIGVSAVRTFEVFAGSEGESLPVLEATEVRRKPSTKPICIIAAFPSDNGASSCIVPNRSGFGLSHSLKRLPLSSTLPHPRYAHLLCLPKSIFIWQFANHHLRALSRAILRSTLN